MGSSVSSLFDIDGVDSQVVKETVGTDATYHVGELLKCTTKEFIPDDNPPEVVVEKIPVPYGYLLHNVFTAEECRQLIEIGEEMGFTPSPLRNLDTINSNSFSYNSDTQSIRTSLRVLFDAPEKISAILNARVTPHLPPVVECMHCEWKLSTEKDKCGGALNKRWRLNKYRKGDFFKPHFDAGFQYDSNECTLLTFILYLNEGFEGGETIFYPEDKENSWSPPKPGIQHTVVPKVGTALVFIQSGRENPRHEGATLLSEDKFKYILRTDVGYVMQRIVPINQ